MTVCSDELNHASIIDGCRLARADVRVYRHRDVEQLDELLRAAPGPAPVVTDAVFSMDGDVAPLASLAEVCARWGALLVIDEAHAVLHSIGKLSPIEFEEQYRRTNLAQPGEVA